MKKIVSLLLTLCMVIPLSVSAFILPSSADTITDDLYKPLNSNFVKTVTFSEENVDLDALNLPAWCREDFIHLYELGFTELATPVKQNDPFKNFCSETLVYETFYKFMRMYSGQDIGKEYRDQYLLTKGVLPKKAEATSLSQTVERTSEISYRKDFYRHTIQIMLTRLIDVVDIGEPINSLTSIPDIDKNDDDRINHNDVLELYNYGIFAGNERGMFNAYDYITRSEFITIMARLCFPNRRVKLDPEEFNKKASTPPETIQTYNDLDSDWFKRMKELTHLDSFYVESKADDRIITIGEAQHIMSFVRYNDVPQINDNVYYCSAGKFELPVKSGSEDCFKIYSTDIRNPEEKRELLTRNISKKELALLLMNYIEAEFGIHSASKVPLNPNVTSGLNEEKLHLLTSAVALGLIENTVEDFSQETITKAEFEKIAMFFALKFSTCAPQNGHLRGEDRVNIIYDPSLLPNNADIFPYVTDMLPKEAYELLSLKNSLGANLYGGYNETPGPILMNEIFGGEFRSSCTNIRDYFNAVLNIDYRTIDAEKLKQKLSYLTLYSVFPEGQEAIDEYVEYVKEHKIILSGEGMPAFPYMYQPDLIGVVACRLKVNVISSDIENPKLYPSLQYILGTDNDVVRYILIPVSPSAYGNIMPLY